MKLTKISLKRPVTVFMLLVSVLVLGIIASRLLPLEFFPSLDAPFITINIPYPNSTPEQIEKEITRPVEEILATISDVKNMNSNTTANNVFIFMEFEWGVDTDIKAIEAREKIENIRSQLPNDMQRFFVQKFNTSDQPILMLRISSKRDLSDSYNLLNNRVKKRIERLKGVSKVELYGVEKREIHIELIADRIIAHHVDLNQLSAILRNANFMSTAGKITDNNKRFTVRPFGEIKTVEELKNLSIGKNNLKIKDIAEVKYESPELDYGRHLNRTYAIGLNVFKKSGANIVDIGNRVKKEIEDIKNDPKMEGINIYFMDDLADGIVSSLEELLKSGLFGALLAIIILYFFLRQWSSTLIVALAVPFSLLVTLVFMFFFKISLNILSMLGLLLAVGMLVDNTVVVTENIFRYQKIESKGNKTTLKAVNEVALAITAGTATTAIVFLPNVLSSSEIAIQIKFVAVSFIISLGASLLVAQTIVPLFASKIKPKTNNNKKIWINNLAQRYSRLLNLLLNHRKTSIFLIIIILFSVIIPIKMVKQDMFPRQQDRRIHLFFHINDYYTVERVEKTVDIIENYLFKNKEKFEIDSVYSYYTGDFAESTILLYKGEKAKKSQEEISEKIMENLPQIAIGNPSLEFRRSSTSGADTIRIQLVGKSTEGLISLSRDIAWTLEQIKGLNDVRSEAVTGNKEIHVVVNRNRAKLYGLSPRDIAGNISVAMRGVPLRKMHNEDGEIDVQVSFQKKDKKTLENLQNIILYQKDKQPIKLSALADFKVTQGPNTIRRNNRITSVGVTMNLKDTTLNQAKDKIKNVLDDYSFPSGVSWNYGRSFDFEQEAAKTMLINTLLALALIYFVMASLFESLIFPGAIWTSIIFAIIGVWWFFLFTGTTFSIMAWIGVLILIGVVVNNGIVLIDHINQLRAAGLDRHKAIVKAGENRIRPILMTAGTTILSLVPLCISTTQIGSGGPPYFPMARAIVGGLAFSTIVTLLILPEIYLLLDDLRNWSRKIIAIAKK